MRGNSTRYVERNHEKEGIPHLTFRGSDSVGIERSARFAVIEGERVLGYAAR